MNLPIYDPRGFFCFHEPYLVLFRSIRERITISCASKYRDHQNFKKRFKLCSKPGKTNVKTIVSVYVMVFVSLYL